MFGSAIRSIAYAGALATGLVLGGVGAATAIAETGDTTDGPGVESTPPPKTVESPGPPEVGAGGGAVSEGSSDDTNRPTSTIGNGRNDVVEPNAPIKHVDESSIGKPAKKYKPFVIPMLRIPTMEEFAEPGWTPPSAFITTLEVPVPTLEDVVRAFSQPEPEPTPGPAFRTQEDAPVVDAAPSGSGGIDQVAANAEPPVFHAPLVMAPTMPLSVAGRVAPLGAPGRAGPSLSAGVPPTAAGVRLPLIRGSLPPSAAPAPKSLTPMSGQATRVGYPRYLRNPTVGELSAIALPGVGGLMFLTFSGGVIGYRQANSTRYIRTSGAARFLE